MPPTASTTHVIACQPDAPHLGADGSPKAPCAPMPPSSSMKSCASSSPSPTAVHWSHPAVQSSPRYETKENLTIIVTVYWLRWRPPPFLRNGMRSTTKVPPNPLKHGTRAVPCRTHSHLPRPSIQSGAPSCVPTFPREKS